MIELSGKFYISTEDDFAHIFDLSIKGEQSALDFLSKEQEFWSAVGVFQDVKNIEATISYQAYGALIKLNGQLAKEDFLEGEVGIGWWDWVLDLYQQNSLPLHQSAFAKLFERLVADNERLALQFLESWLGFFGGSGINGSPPTLTPSAEQNMAEMLVNAGCLRRVAIREPNETTIDAIVDVHALIDQLMQQQKALQAENAQVKKEWKQHQSDEKESFENACKKLTAEGVKIIAQLDSKLVDITNKGEALNSAIMLDTSKNYWEKKAKVHMWTAMSFGALTCVYFSILGCLVWYLFGQLPVLLTEQPIFLDDNGNLLPGKDANLHLYAVQAALGLASSTLIFWVGRLLTRLFLSEHHLRIDAGERVVMMKTYLAFTAKGKMTENQISLLLAPLFRPTADGIVKDDAAPDWSLPAILSKTGVSN